MPRRLEPQYSIGLPEKLLPFPPSFCVLPLRNRWTSGQDAICRTHQQKMRVLTETSEFHLSSSATVRRDLMPPDCKGPGLMDLSDRLRPEKQLSKSKRSPETHMP